MRATKYNQGRPKKVPPHLSLADLRYVSGKTLDDICAGLAEHLGRPMTRSALCAIENGNRGASTAVLQALEVVYGLRPGALVTDYEPRERRSDLEAAS